MGFSSSTTATGGPGTDRTLRLVIKLAQLLASIYLIVAMYNIGPHWILLMASLAVPLYGLFLLFRSPDRTFRQHPLAYVRYKALARARSWIRVDLAICATMAVVCLAFALVLLLGYFLERSANTFLLHAAVASLLLSLLYSLNAILSVRQLQTGRVDFIMEKQNASSSVSTTRASTQSPIGEPVAGGGERVPTANGHSSPYRAFEDGWRSTQRPLSVSIQSPKSGDEPAGPASLLEQLQSELAAELQAKGGPWRQIPIELPADKRRGQRQGEEAEEVVGRRVERQVKVEQRRSTPFGVDVGAFGSREEQKWTKESGGEQLQDQRQNSAATGSSRWRRGGDAEIIAASSDSKMLPRLAVQQREDGPRIRGEWSGTVGDRKEQLAAHHLPSPHQPPPFPASASAASSSAPAENDQQQQQLIKNTELRRTIERKRVRYEAVASKTLVDVDHSPDSISPTSAAGGQRIERRV